jgi:hypothetical protein
MAFPRQAAPSMLARVVLHSSSSFTPDRPVGPQRQASLGLSEPSIHVSTVGMRSKPNPISPYPFFDSNYALGKPEKSLRCLVFYFLAFDRPVNIHVGPAVTATYIFWDCTVGVCIVLLAYGTPSLLPIRFHAHSPSLTNL